MDARTRMEREAEDAEKALLEGAAPEPKPEDKAGLPGGEPKPDENPTPVPEKKPEGDAEVAALRAEIAQLKAQLDGENSQTFKARYQTLQGMFNAETGKLKAEIEDLKKQLEAKAEPAPVATPAMTDDVFQALVKEIGQPAAEILRNAAAAKDDTEIVALRAELAALKGETKAANEKAELVQAQTAEERFFLSLNSLVPDWKKVNGWEDDGLTQDPEFTKFMAEVIPGVGITYQQAMNRHYGERNVAGVAEIFNLFKKLAGVAPALGEKPDSDLERYIEPDKTGKGGKPPAPGAADKEIIPIAEYEAFTNSIVRGTFRGTREERLKLEAKYDKAMSEDRIR